MKTNLVEIGLCSAPHGIKGGFTFALYSGEDSVLDQGMSVYLYPKDARSSLPAEGKSFTIASITYGHKIIVYLEGIQDRNKVEAILPFTISINREDFPELEEDEFYIADLIQADVFDLKSGEKIGILRDVYDNGMQDIFVISTYDHGNIEVLNIPTFVHEIDVEEKRIVITIPEVLSERE